MAHILPYYISVRITPSDCPAVFPTGLLPRLHAAFHSAPMLSTRVPTVLSYCSTGISTCCPSATTLVLALGPDLPRQISFTLETLDIRPRGFPPLSRYSFRHSLFDTLHSSFRYCFVAYPMLLYQCLQTFLSFGVVFQPRTFSAQDLSTSELLRTL